MIGIDLFAGAGGMSLGASMAGVSVELAVELDPHAVKTYLHNNPQTKVYGGDIRRVTRKHLQPWITKRDDLVVFGGPPCQGFSWSNVRTRSANNGENWLFTEFLRIVGLLKPAWVVFENVQGIVDTVQGMFLEQITEGLEDLRYTVCDGRLNAMHFGVPQDRTRFFLVGSRDGRPFDFPNKTTAAALTVNDAIRDLPRLKVGAPECWKQYGRARPSAYGNRMRKRLDGCCNHLVTENELRVFASRSVAKTLVGRNQVGAGLDFSLQPGLRHWRIGGL